MYSAFSNSAYNCFIFKLIADDLYTMKTVGDDYLVYDPDTRKFKLLPSSQTAGYISEVHIVQLFPTLSGHYKESPEEAEKENSAAKSKTSIPEKSIPPKTPIATNLKSIEVAENSTTFNYAVKVPNQYDDGNDSDTSTASEGSIKSKKVSEGSTRSKKVVTEDSDRAKSFDFSVLFKKHKTALEDSTTRALCKSFDFSMLAQRPYFGKYPKKKVAEKPYDRFDAASTTTDENSCEVD